MQNFLLADDMGLGKSLQALTTFAVDVIRGWATTAIVVAPATLKANWAKEVKKYTRFEYLVIDGTDKKRREQLSAFSLMDGPKILIMNYEQVGAYVAELNAMAFDVSIFDEAHMIKNPDARRSLACMHLRTRRNFVLTGSPMLNQAQDLWVPLHRCNRFEFPSYHRFVNRYCVMGGYNNKQVVGVKNEAELREKLGKYMIRRLKSEVLNLPEVQVITRMVDLLPEQRKMYDKALDEMVIENPNGDDIEISSPVVKFGRLRQICGTTAAFLDADISGKLDLAIQDLREISRTGNKVVVFTQYRDVLKCFTARAQKIGVPVFELHGDIKKENRQDIVDRWSDTSGAAAMAAMIQVGGTGLNMTAARYGMFLDELFAPLLNQQAIDRMHRIGASETQPVQIYRYHCNKTVEDRVDNILAQKKQLFEDIVETTPWQQALKEEILERRKAKH